MLAVGQMLIGGQLETVWRDSGLYGDPQKNWHVLGSLVGGGEYLFGKLGEHLEDGETEGERGDGHRDVGLHCPGLHQLL